MAIQISFADLSAKVNQGWKKDALASHYNLPMSQMTQVLKDANLKIRKFHKPKYELVYDEVQQDSPLISESELVSQPDTIVSEIQYEPEEIQTISSEESGALAVLDAISSVSSEESSDSSW